MRPFSEQYLNYNVSTFAPPFQEKGYASSCLLHTYEGENPAYLRNVEAQMYCSKSQREKLWQVSLAQKGNKCYNNKMGFLYPHIFRRPV